MAVGKEPSEDVGVLKKRILANRRSVAKAQIDMIADIERIRGSMSDDDLRSFLVVECGVPQTDISAILSFNEILGDHAHILRKRATSFPVVKAIITANPATRQAALDSLAAGDDVDVATISALRRIATRNSIGERAYSERSRQRALRSSANAKTAFLVEALGEATVTLLDKIDSFVDQYEPEPSYDPDDHVVYAPGHDAGIKDISELAKSVFRQFQGLYGDIVLPEAGLDGLKAGSNRHRLAAAQESLKRFARGRFGFGEQGYGFAFERGNLWSSELQEALEFLLPCKTAPEPAAPEQADEAQPLRFLEICAGAGGQAIGLLGAGFTPVALFDMNKNAAKTLRKNWNWTVRKIRIEEVKDVDLRQYHGIDLLAGGVECRAFSGAGKQKGEKDNRNLFDEAVRYVDIIRPRAFFFENVDGFTHEKFIRYRAKVFRKLKALGYKIGLHRMNAEDFGLAQSRERVVLVGIRDDQPGLFSTPTGGQHTTMRDTLAEILFPHRGRGGAVYDEWAENWLAKYGGQTSYTVLSSLYKARGEIVQRWKSELGFEIDAKHIGDEPAALGTIADTNALPFLTVDVVKALQGFPKAWKFEGGAVQQFYQIGNAFPPQMAKAVGLAIFRALSGRLPNSIDAPPLVPFDETLIGIKPAIMPPRLRLNAMTKQDVYDLKDRYGKKFKDAKKLLAQVKAADKERKLEMAAYLKQRDAQPEPGPEVEPT
ncbi:DNA-cytosine methyltransferase [Rhizobium sp. BK312]|uniref:DNA cytosine methyltransferase n=1 Tax=Rhizobium sp. BK312 TaxID=2587080 RepID=UPI000DDB1A19|nr:DNA (cytosine-5-)-methyltransferase [Rhizobium sp. BK312]MBB3427972.1 DNA-cytosine methyltransferase [Rhizobium sp. BK312]